MTVSVSSGAGARDPRPVVRLARQGLPLSLIAAMAAATGLLLFAILEHGRAERAVPATRAPRPTVESLDLPELVVPPPPAPSTARVPVGSVIVPPVPPARSPRIVYIRAPGTAPPPSPPAERVSAEPVLTFDSQPLDMAAVAPTGGGDAGSPRGDVATRPARATRMQNLSTTVPQGTLIPAVLETALDSTRPGLVRAIVSTDTRGFDGTRILIPRGSRLVGAYQSQTTPGQKRALVTWTRLIRPDGVSIELVSPGGDTLGRAGITGSVDNHFFERFGDALLQSALSLGVNVATAKVTDVPLILGSPGTFSGSMPGAFGDGQRTVAPTVRVKQGTPISIFVARDLDFGGFELGR